MPDHKWGSGKITLETSLLSKPKRDKLRFIYKPGLSRAGSFWGSGGGCWRPPCVAAGALPAVSDGEAVSFNSLTSDIWISSFQETIDQIAAFVEATNVPFHPISTIARTTNTFGDVVPVLPQCSVELSKLSPGCLSEFGDSPVPASRTRVKVCLLSVSDFVLLLLFQVPVI